MAVRLDEPASIDSDSLGRLSLAKAIYTLVKSAPPDWTLRIGVYGAWGEGKTSLLNLVANLAQADGLPIARFNPSLASDNTQLWNAFFLAVADAFDAPARATNPLVRLGWRFRRLRARVGKAQWLGRLLKAAEPSHPVAGPLFRIADLASDGFRARIGLSATHIETLLSTELANRRLLVLIDDLDRTEPALVPRLLLAIRELNVSLTAFVVAIDPVVVTKGLHDVHPGWETAPEFLEKILQFHYWLTPPARRELLQLAVEQIPETGLPIPPDVVEQLFEDLPPNPRKLKEFFRSLWQLRPIVARHDADEIDWYVLLILERVRAEAPLLAATLFRSESFRKNAAASTFFRKTEGDDDDKLLQEIKTQIEHAGGKSLPVASHERILGLVTRLGDAPLTTADKIDYWASIRENPPAVTRREARHARAEFATTPSGTTAAELVKRQTSVSGATIAEVVPGLLSQLLTIRDEELSIGIEDVAPAEIATSAAEADKALHFVEVLVSDVRVFHNPQYGCGARQLVILYQHFAKWAETTGPEYASIRARERDVILSAGRDSGRFAVDVLDEFDIVTKHRSRSDAARALRAQLVEVLLVPVVLDLQHRFERQDGLVTALRQGGHSTHRYLLLNPLAGLYEPEFIDKLREMAVRARSDFAIQRNFITLLEAMTSAYTWSNAPITDEAKPRIEAAKQILSVVWAGATAAMVPTSTVRTLREARESLSAFADGDDRFSLPKWWPIAEDSEHETDPSGPDSSDHEPESD